ncbi:MAG: DUF5312 domain-containing protein [Spirochaetaceae bacterium]|jgi:hypothetical protein|nr:DUF5312 domain-containing protein [Spirochaetaceae bacterium]
MEEAGTMSRLASSLSLTERKELLEKLKSLSLISQDPLYQDTDDSNFEEDAERRFSKLSIFLRIWYYILGLFKSQSPLAVFKNRELVKLGKEAETKAPGFYSASGYLLPQFYEAIGRLKANSRFFYSALDTGFSRDKGAFYGFLGSLEMEEIHSRLVSETDPAIIADKHPGLPESALRQLAQKEFEEAIQAISEEQRGRMYAAARSLSCLRELSSFLYDRFIMAFTNNAGFGGMACRAVIVRDALVSLNNILFSLKECPPMSLLESLFIFILQEQGAGADVQSETQKLLTQAETSIAAIRDFNRKIPLALVARIAARDISLAPKTISGGEDWFALYKDYWKRHIDSAFFAYFGNRRRRELQKTCAGFFQGVEPRFLANAESETKPDGLPVLHAESLGFLLTFYSSVFMTGLNPFLRTVLIDGEFYKKDNKLEYTENYNELIKLDDMIGRFDENLAPRGDWGKRYAQTRKEISAPVAKRRKFQIIQEEIDEQAAAIVEGAGIAMNGMVKVLNGITDKEADGNYDTLSNLPQLNGKSTKFTEGLRNAALKLKEGAGILKAIGRLETGK